MKEGRRKVNPRPGQGLNPGPSGLESEILPTVQTRTYVCQNCSRVFDTVSDAAKAIIKILFPLLMCK